MKYLVFRYLEVLVVRFLVQGKKLAVSAHAEILVGWTQRFSLPRIAQDGSVLPSRDCSGSA